MCLVHLLGLPSLAQMHFFISFDHTSPVLECLKKFPQMVAKSLLPSSHKILCASRTSNTEFLPPTFLNPTAARRLQSKSLKDFSCPILALMRISTMIRSCALCCNCIIPRDLIATYPQLKLSLATLYERHTRLLIGSPLFLIVLFVVLDAKHGELKRMPFEFEPSKPMTHCAHIHVRCVRCGSVIACSFKIK